MSRLLIAASLFLLSATTAAMDLPACEREAARLTAEPQPDDGARQSIYANLRRQCGQYPQLLFKAAGSAFGEIGNDNRAALAASTFNAIVIGQFTGEYPCVVCGRHGPDPFLKAMTGVMGVAAGGLAGQMGNAGNLGGAQQMRMLQSASSMANQQAGSTQVPAGGSFLTLCEQYFRTARPPAAVGDSCADQRSTLAYYQQMQDLIQQNCPAEPSGQQVALRIAQAKPYVQGFIDRNCNR